MAYARSHRTVVALSGETDIVTDGERVAAVANGHPLMAKVTAMGCAGSAVLSACLAVEPDAFRAAVAALVIMGGKDDLVPPRHGEWIDEAYKREDVEHKLIIFPEAGHGLEGEQNRSTLTREAVEWFDRHLAKKAG